MTQPKNRKKREVENYTHTGKERVNNPPVGLVTPETDKDAGKTTYAYDPHLDPQLVWAGKAEHTSFKVPTVSLHVHERIDPRTIVEAVRRRSDSEPQCSLFAVPAENPPIRQAIEFYKHKHNWTNRLIAGDSLLEKEGLGGQVQMVYIDPPYGIRYSSNFQPFVNKREVTDGKDEDLTQEPETIRAFRDTWELGIHSYLAYLRDRLLLARELLHESGSVFMQIGDENLHHVREMMDETLGKGNFVAQIYFSTTGGFAASTLSRVGDYLVWYARDRTKVKYRQLFLEKPGLKTGDKAYKNIELADGSRRLMSKDERSGRKPLPEGSRIFRYDNLQSSGSASSDTPFEFEGEVFRPNRNNCWKTTCPDGMTRLKAARRIGRVGNTLSYIRYMPDNPVKQLTNSWMDTSFSGYATDKKYVVETNPKVIQRCILMTTDPGDLVFDPTCGSGTTAYVAEQRGRRWITCDTSRVATALAKQRLMTANFDYYELAHLDEGVGSGFKYRTVPHITLKSIANNPDIREGMGRAEIDAAIARHAPQETLCDHPRIDRGKARVTGPFTVEAVPAPAVKPLDAIEDTVSRADDASVARSGETLRQGDWRDELLKTGIRGKDGQRISFARLEPLPRNPMAACRRGNTARRCGDGRLSRPRYCLQSGTARGLVWAGSCTAGTAAGDTRHRGGTKSCPTTQGYRLCGLPVRSRSVQGHRRDPLARRHLVKSADERRFADRRPQEEAGEQRELLADRPAGRGSRADQGRRRPGQVPCFGSRIRLLQHQNRQRGIGRLGQDRHVDARSGL